MGMTGSGGNHRLRAAWLGLLCSWGLCAAALATPLEQWRAEADRVRRLAENDTVQAAAQVLGLASALPDNAPPADRARLLNLRARVALYQGRTGDAARDAAEAFALAERHGDRIGQAEADLVVALNTVNQGRFDRLAAVTDHAVKILEGVDRPDLLAEAQLRLAMRYTRFGKLEESVDACVRTQELARRSRHALALAYAHQCMGSSYNQSDNHRQSLEEYRGMQVQARAAGSRLLEAQALGGQGGVLAAQGDLAGGEALVRQSSAIYRSIGMPFYLTASLFAEASQARMQDDHARALQLLNEAEATYERLPNKTGLWWTLTARSGDYIALKRYGAAEADLQRSLAIARELGVPLYLSESENLLGRLAALRGDHRKAYAHALAAAELTARAHRQKVNTRVLELTERYQQEARQREIADLTRRNALQQVELREHSLQQRWLWTVLGVIGVALPVLGFFLLRLRRSQEALQRQTGILQSVLDSMGDGVVVADESGKLVLVNPAAERIVGLGREAGGARWPAERRFYRPDRETPWPLEDLPLARAVRRDLGGGSSAEVYMAGPGLPDGRWLRMTALPLAGQRGGAVAVISDITEHRRAEEEIRALNASLEGKVQQRTGQLRQQARYQRVLIDTIPWWVWLKDTESRYLAVNLATARILGCDADAMVGKSDYDVKPADVARAFREDDLKVMHTRCPQTVEEVQQGPDGPLWIEIFKTPVIDDDGTVLGTVGLARDISARKAAEAARDAALLEAQHLARMRSDFLAQMTHELRTPLNAVLGFVQLLQRDGQLNARQRSSISAIGHSGEHLLGLINNVLDSAKLGANKMQLYAEPFDLAACLDGVAALMRGRAAEKGLDFRCVAGDGLPGSVLADEQRLRQVLLNLLSNAIRFTDQGVVSLRVSLAGAGRLRFAVQDSGVGIEQAALETIFHPFEQVGEAQRRFGGTGLGLAISRQLVRLMGSEIQVESQPGVGSLFWFELALQENAAAQAVPAPVLAEEAVAGAPLAAPPREQLRELMKLVRIGNMRAVLAHAEELERRDARYRPFAGQVSRLAHSYQSRALRQMVERYLQPAATTKGEPE